MSTYEDSVLSSLNKLLGQKDELTNAVKELFNHIQVYERRTSENFDRVNEIFKGIHARLSKVEEQKWPTLPILMGISCTALGWIAHWMVTR